jgi:hypothetical protein
MEIEKLIMDTFTAHEHVAPDSDAVLDAARERIDRRVSRPLAVAAGVVVLTLAAVAVVVLNRPGDVRTGGPANGTPTTAPAPSGAPAFAGLPMPFDLGWLPDGEVDYQVRRINTGGTAENPDVPVYNGEYMVDVTVGGQVLDIDVQEFRMSSVEEAAFKSGPGTPVTINGKQGVEGSFDDSVGGYELYFPHPQEGSLYVNVSASAEHGSTADKQQLIDIGRRIGENIRFPGTTEVTPTFGLGDLPGGLAMCTFDVEKGLGEPGNNTSYEVGDNCAAGSSINVTVTNPNGPRGAAGQPVQGLETRYTEKDGYRSLWLLDAVGGEPLLVAGSAPESELYAVANALQLPR